MHLKTSLAQVKDQCNISIFYVKLEEKIRTNVNHARKNLLIDQILRKSSIKSKNVPNFDDDKKKMTIFQINEIST